MNGVHSIADLGGNVYILDIADLAGFLRFLMSVFRQTIFQYRSASHKFLEHIRLMLT